MSEVSDRAERIRAAVQAAPSQMTMQLARKLGVPEVEVIRALPDGRAVELEVGRWRELFESMPALGVVTVIVSNAATTCEATGTFGGFSEWGEFFNVQSGSLDLHIRPAQLAAAFAVVKPSHMDGEPTLSVQFYDYAGAAAIKVFLNFGGALSADRRAWFKTLKTTFGKAPLV
jgi:putative hemin transport protein